MSASVRVPRDKCGNWLGDTYCGEPAPYAVFFEDCPPCLVGRGYGSCVGHGVCDAHAVHARNGNRRSYVDGSSLRVARIKSHGEPERAA